MRATVKQFVNQGLEVTVGHNLSGTHGDDSSINQGFGSVFICYGSGSNPDPGFL